jgi:phenylacetate-CoA ligase
MVNILKVLYLLGSANRRLHWDKKRLKIYQDKRFKAVIKFANETVPFYHRSFKEAGVDVNSIKGIEDLPKLPIVTKEQLKRLPPQEIVSSKYDYNKLKKVRTSGSTGKPLQIYISPDEDAWRKAIYMRANINCGQKPRDHWVLLTAPHHFGDTTLIQKKIGLYAQTCISLFESNETKIRQVEKAKVNVLDGYSGSLLMLAKEVKKRDIKTIKPHLIFGNAELIDIQARKYLEGVFDAPYCDQFGCAEVDRSAWQCLERDGYHMDVDSVITEFVDTNAEPVSNGEHGEVTYTSLFNFAMPLIRYSIGDIGVPSDGECPCGNILPLMKIVEGRKDSFLILPNNRIVSPFAINLEASSFKYFPSIDQYHIRQKKIDLLEVYLKLNDYSIDPQLIAAEFEIYLKAFLNIKGDEVQLKTSFIDQLTFTNGGKLSSVSSDIKSADNWSE